MQVAFSFSCLASREIDCGLLASKGEDNNFMLYQANQ